MPESVLIQYENGRMTLNLPLFFKDCLLGDARKVFKLLRECPRLNKPAFETLDLFFRAWDQELTQQLECDTQELKDAEQAVKEAKRQIASFGTMVTKEMKDNLQEVQKTAKKAALKVKRTKSALERCGKIKNAYNTILR